jgi:hypothetical protein
MDNNTDNNTYNNTDNTDNIRDNINFIKADNNTIINLNAIRWIKKMDECLAVCSKSDGCVINSDTHKICKTNNYDSYALLNKYFN